MTTPPQLASGLLLTISRYDHVTTPPQLASGLLLTISRYDHVTTPPQLASGLLLLNAISINGIVSTVYIIYIKTVHNVYSNKIILF